MMFVERKSKGEMTLACVCMNERESTWGLAASERGACADRPTE